jgi:co-chaperonin GroES (HSP10)
MMKPTGNRLLVRVKPDVVKEAPKKEVKKGEAIPVLPTVKGNTVITALVLDVGPKCNEVSKGDSVIFSPYGIDEVEVNGEKLVIVGEDVILAYEHKK